MQSMAKDTLRTLIIPLQNCNLLLPNVAVAEVVPYVRSRAMEGAPDWMLGTISWRGLNIPLISYDRLYGSAEGNLGQARIAVLNTVNRDNGISFYAIVTAGIPQLKRVSEDLLEQQAESAGNGAVCKVKVGDIEAVIPDLQLLESSIVEHWTSAA